MISTRSKSFVVGLVFISLAIKASAALYTNQGPKKIAAATGNGLPVNGSRPLVAAGKHTIDGVEDRKGLFGGRKMMMMKKKEMKVLGKEIRKKEEDGPLISGAIHFIRAEGNNVKGQLREITRSIRSRSSSSSSSSTTRLVKAKMSSLVADYNSPKSHPPKNN